MKDKQLKICPRCNASFTCCSESDCWCETVQVPPKAFKYAMMHYADCICKDCLIAIGKETESKAS